LAEPAVIVGHSLGALVALGAAAAVPHLVRAIVLEDPPSSNSSPTSKIPPTSFSSKECAASPEAIAHSQRVAADLAEIRLPDGGRLGDRRDAVALRFLARCLAISIRPYSRR